MMSGVLLHGRRVRFFHARSAPISSLFAVVYISRCQSVTSSSYSPSSSPITTSVDGHLKLWKKQEVGIEFVKHYRAHLAPIVSVSASADGTIFASVSEDEMAKVFDVVNFGAYLKNSSQEFPLNDAQT